MKKMMLKTLFLGLIVFPFLFSGCRSPRISHGIEITDRSATPNEIIAFYKAISFYICDDAEIAKELVLIKQQLKIGMQIPKRKLDLLQKKIEEHCSQKKTVKHRFYSRLKISYLYGDAPAVKVKLEPIHLFQNPTKHYQTIINTAIESKIGDDHDIIIPCGFYSVLVSAPLKQPVRVSCMALPDDTFIIYFATTKSYEKILSFRGENILTLKHGIAYLCVNSKKPNATFTLKAPFKIAPSESKPSDIITQKLIEKYPKLKDYYSSPELKMRDLIEKYPELRDYYLSLFNLSSMDMDSSKYKRFITLLQTDNGVDVIKLPTPIFLAVPAGEYILNGKKFLLDTGAFKKLWVK